MFRGGGAGGGDYPGTDADADAGCGDYPGTDAGGDYLSWAFAFF